MRWFGDIKIRNKLFIVFGILLSVATFFAVYAVVGIINVSNNLEELINTYQTRQIHLAEAIADVYRIRLVNLSKGYLLEEDLTEIVSELNIDLDENIGLFTENLHSYRELVNSDNRFTLAEKQARLNYVDEIMELFDEFLDITRVLDAAAESNDKQEMVSVIEESIQVGNELSRRVRELRDRIFSTTRQKAAETQDVTYRTLNIIFIISVLFILISALFMLFTVRNIDQPITKLEKAMVEIAKGDLSYPVRSERKDELGTLANCVGDMIDELVKFNEKKQQEELLQEALNAAKSASAAKSSFLANMSHEIRTPMNVVLGVTEILLQDEKLAPETTDALRKIYNSGDLLLSIINDILDLSKIEAGKLELSPHKYDLASLINDTVTLNMMRIGSKPIEFVLSVDENLPSTLKGDDLRIKQILNNLLSNAFKYTDRGLVRLKVFAENASPGGDSTELVFVVSDTGQGMSVEQVEKLFDEYARFNSEANRTTEGTGLGMSIVRNLIELMNGSISVESEVNLGTAFTVRLQQGGADSAVLGKELAESLQSFQLNDLKQSGKAQIVYERMPYGRVLIVDDAETNLYVAQGLMAPYELTIETANSGFKAIERIKDGNVYDIVFMDHMMPIMDGIEATAKIREMGYMHPVVALTANAVAGQAEVFLANGFDGFISKPIDMRQLNEALKKFVRDKQPPNVVMEARSQAGESSSGKNGSSVHNGAPASSGAVAHSGSPAQSAMPAQNARYLRLMEYFILDANRASTTLEELLSKAGALTDADLQLFTTTVHAMKSALANVGETELSSFAAYLEQAGRNKDTVLISAETNAFLRRLQAIALKLTPPEQTYYTSDTPREDRLYLCERLLAVKEACEVFDKRTAKEIITTLRHKNWPQKIKQMLDTMAEQLLSGDFDEVSQVSESIIKRLSFELNHLPGEN